MLYGSLSVFNSDASVEIGEPEIKGIIDKVLAITKLIIRKTHILFPGNNFIPSPQLGNILFCQLIKITN